jgi:transposase
VRRDFLDAGRAFCALQEWALQWKARIGTLCHLNRLRLEQWDRERALSEQSALFNEHHEDLKNALQLMHDEAARIVAPQSGVAQHTEDAHTEGVAGAELSKSARTKRKKVLASLLAHWSGPTVFVAHPEVPMDNNLGENSIRTPVNGRKNYYGSGGICSAQFAAMLFAILQTQVLWGINPRHWLRCYLSACAQNGGSAPHDIEPFVWFRQACVDRDLRRPTMYGRRAIGPQK